jgi:hypothetical protein
MDDDPNRYERHTRGSITPTCRQPVYAANARAPANTASKATSRHCPPSMALIRSGAMPSVARPHPTTRMKSLQRSTANARAGRSMSISTIRAGSRASNDAAGRDIVRSWWEQSTELPGGGVGARDLRRHGQSSRARRLPFDLPYAAPCSAHGRGMRFNWEFPSPRIGRRPRGNPELQCRALESVVQSRAADCGTRISMCCAVPEGSPLRPSAHAT